MSKAPLVKNTRQNDLGVTMTFPTNGSSAIKYYRMEVPLHGIHTGGFGHTFLNEKDGDIELAFRVLMGSDIGVYWRPMNKDSYDYFKEFSEYTPIDKDGVTVYPPLLLIDSDDAIDWIHPFNHAYNALGVRDQEGNILTPGQNVYVNYGGKKEILWEDGFTRGQGDKVFDIARNLQNIGYHYDIARVVSGVTVTNDFLAQIYKDQGCEEVYVFPNSVIPEHHWHPDLVPHEGVRILWEGGASHLDSWISIKPPIIDVLKNNPHAKLVVFGDHFDWMEKEIAPEQLELHPWVDYAGYKLYRACMDADINLAPLTDSAFTRAKSAIRWYEASLGPNPEATLAANVGPYKEIEHNKTGMLYNTPQEFAEMLHGLIANADLRKTLGAGAQKWVLANRTVEKTVPGLVEFYKSLLAKQRREFLKP